MHYDARPSLAYRHRKASRSLIFSLNGFELAGAFRIILFSRTPDRVFLITSPYIPTSDATALMRHPCLMAGSPGPPVRALLTGSRSNKKGYYPT